MPGQIIHIPRAFVKPFDPREQDVVTDDSIARAKAAREAALSEPCTVCRHAMKHHWSMSGSWVGCDGAPSQARPYPDAQRWNNPWPTETAQLRDAMLAGRFGSRMEIDMAHYTRSESLDLAAAIVRFVKEQK